MASVDGWPQLTSCFQARGQGFNSWAHWGQGSFVGLVDFSGYLVSQGKDPQGGPLVFSCEKKREFVV